MADAARMAAAPDQRPVYEARHFADLPSAARARAALADIASGSLNFGPVAPDRPIALYGAGNLGRLARDFMRVVGHDFALVIDRDAKTLKADPAWAGVQVIHPEDVPQRVKSDMLLAVSVVTTAFVPLQRSLSAAGFAHVVPFYDLAEHFRDRHPLSNGWFAQPLSAPEYQQTSDVLDGWDDDLSRAHHLQFLAWRQLREEWTFGDDPIANGNRFFIDEVIDRFDEDSVFVDAGAHHGSVSEQFLALSGGAFRQLVAIEPDPENRRVLSATFNRIAADDRRLLVVDAVLAETRATRRFHDGLGYASQLAQTGSGLLETTTLDSLALAPTFLKLHLEGGEGLALEGAVDTIYRHRPIVAVTVYHNADGQFKTPFWMMRNLGDYRFQFRLHSWCGTGAVIYGFPITSAEQGP